MDRSVDLSSPNSLRTDDAQMADHVEGPHVLENFGAQGQRQPTFFRQTKMDQGRNECRDKWIKWRNKYMIIYGEIENNARW